MFYTDDDLDDLLTCSKCKNRMYDPRMLPCGNMLCNDCITSNNDHFKCPICSQDHVIPKSGFLRNESIARFLIKKRPHEIYRGRKVEQLKLLLDKLKTASKDLDDHIKYGENKIKEYIDSVKHEIDLAAEIEIKKIQDCRDKLFKEINDYLVDDNNFEQLRQEEINKYNEHVKKMEEFSDKWRTYLNNISINEDDIDLAIVDTKRHINNIQRDNQECKSIVLNKKLIRFDLSTASKSDDNLLGTLKYSCLPGFIDFDRLREFDLIPYSRSSECCEERLFQDGRILIIWKINDINNIMLSIYNQDFHLLSSKDLENIELNEDEVLSSAIIGNYIFIMRFSESSIGRQSCYKINSNNFETEKEINFQEVVDNVAFNSKNIFTLAKDLKISIFDSDLNLINTVGQSISKDLEYYIPKEIFCFFANDQYLFFEPDDNNIVIILDSRDGKFIREVIIDNEDRLRHLYVTSDSWFVSYGDSKMNIISPLGDKIFRTDNKRFMFSSIIEINNYYFFRDGSKKMIYFQ